MTVFSRVDCCAKGLFSAENSIRYSDADPDLNLVQRLYLLTVLNREMDQLRQASRHQFRCAVCNTGGSNGR